VPAKRQPGIQLAMMNQKYLAAMNDEDSDSEINFFVNVGHGELVKGAKSVIC
jgi:hypothetical protein